MRELEFYAMHHVAYRWMPHKSVVGRDSRTNFISLPNDFYDPALGQSTIEDFVELVKNAERLGFDGVIHSEHHNTPIGISAQAMVSTAYLASETERILLGAVGPVLNAYLSPIRLAEEAALVDILSNGRLILGLPMGIGGQYHSYGLTNPAVARARFREAHELLLRAFTEPGPFAFEGEFFDVPYVNLWPKPVQKPHPPIWIPAAGSQETLELVAKYRHTYQIVGGSREVNARNVKRFRDLCEEQGYTSTPNQVAAVEIVHVAETDKQAELEAEGHVLWQMQNFLRSTFQDSFAPGHVSETSLRATALAAGGYRSRGMHEPTFQEIAPGMLIGSPETVAERLEQHVEELDAGRVILMFDHGSNPRWLIDKSMALFAEHVMPKFRPPGGKPIWARGEDRRMYTTASERAAVATGPKAIPAAQLADGTIVDVRTAHVEDLRQPVDL